MSAVRTHASNRCSATTTPSAGRSRTGAAHPAVRAMPMALLRLGPIQARRRCAARVLPWNATHICSAITSLSNELASAEHLLFRADFVDYEGDISVQIQGMYTADDVFRMTPDNNEKVCISDWLRLLQYLFYIAVGNTDDINSECAESSTTTNADRHLWVIARTTPSMCASRSGSATANTDDVNSRRSESSVNGAQQYYLPSMQTMTDKPFASSAESTRLYRRWQRLRGVG